MNTSTTRSTTQDGVLSCFEQSSIRCLTRSEEALLKTAMALVLVQKRRRHQQQQQTNTNPTDGVVVLGNGIQTLVGLESGTASHVTAIMATPFQGHKLLQRSHRDHMDHLFQVACQSAAASAPMTTTTTTSTSSSTTAAIAAHLVEQLDTWSTELLLLGEPGKNNNNNNTKTNKTTGAIHSNNEIELMKPLYHWLLWSLLSHPQASTVHQAMLHHVVNSTSSTMAAPGSTTSHKKKNDYRLLMDCWWNVLVHMISELLFQEERPALPSPSWRLVEQQQSFSWEALAVSLLDLLQLFLVCHRQSGVSTWRRINPEGLHDWVVPLPTPEAILWMHASLANTVSTTCTTTTSGSTTKSGDAVEDDQGGLTAGGKILLRLGLYRILMLEQRTDLIADDDEHFQYYYR